MDVITKSLYEVTLEANLATHISVELYHNNVFLGVWITHKVQYACNTLYLSYKATIFLNSKLKTLLYLIVSCYEFIKFVILVIYLHVSFFYRV
jgi:hypothetical protein